MTRISGGASRLAAAAIGLLLAAPWPASAWLMVGHRQVAIDAVGVLAAEVPPFFRDGAAMIGHVAIDADVGRLRELPELAESEGPEHYLDLELLAGRALPPTRYGAIRLMKELGREPAQVGFLPWAVVEGAERLAVCFAEHRRWPDDPSIRSKCLVYAGWLAHYAADLEQPLHTTLHHDGWALPGGESPFDGTHRRIDALFDRAPRDRARALAGVGAQPVEDLWATVRGELAASHALVDATYALAPALADGEGEGSARVDEFACERYGTTARFLATLFTWAWQRSGSLELPAWVRR